MPTPFRHRMWVNRDSFVDPHARCTCGKEFDDVGLALAHVRLARRWRYLGYEVWYGEKYFMWEHALTGRHYAWSAERYEKETLS